MKATNKNMIDYIIKNEDEQFKALVELERTIGFEAEETIKARASWNVYYEMMKEFNLLSFLER